MKDSVLNQLGLVSGSPTNTTIMDRDAIIAVGNPGAGKSTTLNYLAGEVLFKSGDSFGGGLTSDFNVGHSKESNLSFYDTPGLSDLGLRKAAGKAISKALKEGGTYHIFFFVSQDAGRPKNEDITTMNLVLQAAPEIGTNYSIIVPKIKPGNAEGLRKDENWAKFLNGIFAGIKNGKKCDIKNVHGLMYLDELEGKDDLVVAKEKLVTLSGKPFKSLIWQMPVVKLTRNKAKDIDIRSFEDMQDRLGKLVQEGQRNKAKIEEMEKEVQASRKKQDELAAELEKLSSAGGPSMVNVEIRLGSGKEYTDWTPVQGVQGLSDVKLCKNETGVVEVTENLLSLGLMAAVRREYVIYFRSSLPGGYYYFRDASGDTYYCECGSRSKEYIAFSSPKPTIHQIWHSFN